MLNNTVLFVKICGIIKLLSEIEEEIGYLMLKSYFANFQINCIHYAYFGCVCTPFRLLQKILASLLRSLVHNVSAYSIILSKVAYKTNEFLTRYIKDPKVIWSAI